MKKDEASVISVEIGGATCKIGRVNRAGEVSNVSQYKTQRLREQGLEKLIEILEDYEEKYIVEAVVIALPATVEWGENHVRSSCPDLPWMEEAESIGKLQDRLGRPLQLVNDVEALLFGEWRSGELSGYNSGVVLSLGENMGSALLWDGKPQQGRRGSIMELEHVSLETYGEERDDLPPGSAMNWLSGKGLRSQLEELGLDIKVPEIFTSEDEEVRAVKDEFEDRLAHLLGTIVMMLDPERIVLEGGITRSHRDWLSGVEDKMDEYIMEQFQGLPVVTLGQLRGEDVLLGPAAYWRWLESERD